MVVSNTAIDGSGTWTTVVGWTSYTNGSTISYCPTTSGYYTLCWRFVGCSGYSVAEASLINVTPCVSCTDCTNEQALILPTLSQYNTDCCLLASSTSTCPLDYMIIKNSSADGNGTTVTVQDWRSYTSGTTITFCPGVAGYYTVCWRFAGCYGYGVAELGLNTLPCANLCNVSLAASSLQFVVEIL